jgi:hypothetical protein
MTRKIDLGPERAVMTMRKNYFLSSWLPPLSINFTDWAALSASNRARAAFCTAPLAFSSASWAALSISARSVLAGSLSNVARTSLSFFPASPTAFAASFSAF